MKPPFTLVGCFSLILNCTVQTVTKCRMTQVVKINSDTVLVCLCENAQSFNHYCSVAFMSGTFNTLAKKPKRGVKMTHTVFQ